MSLYADYLKERTHDEILETPDGFATYRYLPDGKTVYIIDIYTTPEARKKGLATALSQQICDLAKAKGCTKMMGTVVPSMKNSTASIGALLAHGMKLDSSADNVIVFTKEI